MKKLVGFALILVLPVFSEATQPQLSQQVILEVPQTSFQRSIPITDLFIEWECAVSEVVKAHDGMAALQKLGEQCITQIYEKAETMTDIYGVLDVSIAWPDVHIEEVNQGYHLEGVIFLKALILQ